MGKSVGIIGCGWLGIPLAKSFLGEKYAVFGSTTTVDKLADMERIGIKASLIDFSKEQTLDKNHEIFKVDYLIISFPPVRSQQVIKTYPNQIRKLCSLVLDFNTKAIFISSTSVYPETNNWVKEEDAIQPERKSGKAILLAEALLKSYFKDRLTILRAGGLFGEGRDFRTYLQNTITEQNLNIPINLVHRKDCIEIIKTVIKKDCFGEIFNLVCDKQVTRQKIFQIDKKTNIILPPHSYKLVDNSKIKQDLDYNFLIKDPLNV